ncbi:hypothetical protein SCLCIDRAFT_30990 [Scleroderma citrinum Foug A]|uniref:Uncharacterized protein n=1 Tax=Scleroderma citrinum Foug A TaxID=1036808 RepID=A0A0C2YY66_9AGAM|nr:hypothetical protein SCLCIDRAFT_30990 [Scleroderma citrinum Foug A]
MAVTVSLLSCPPPSARPGRTDDSSDEPMSPRDRARRRSDKRRAARSPSPCHYCSPSREGRYEKHRRVTAHDDSPPAQWIVTTTGLLVHDPRDQCPECLAYQHHASLDLVLILETSSIINARNDCLTSLVRIMGWDDGAAKLCNELVSEAERALAVSEQQVTSAFEQACLLSMYIPSALRILLGRARPTDLWRNASSLQEEGAGTGETAGDSRGGSNGTINGASVDSMRIEATQLAGDSARVLQPRNANQKPTSVVKATHPTSIRTESTDMDVNADASNSKL